MSEVTMFFGLAAVLIFLLILRAFISRRFGFYLFLIWNMFLATVPVLLMPLFKSFPTVISGLLLVILILLFIIWLLFLPNTFYIVTDFMHLNQDVVVDKQNYQHTMGINYARGDPWFIYDSFQLFLASFYGALAGGYALREFYRFVDVHDPSFALPIIIFVLFTCAFGVYIGRYGRWNSWDAILKPHVVIKDFIKSLIKPTERKVFIIVFTTILMFELLSWILVARR
jgi:uncharacterized membrane protein